jgi:hypothetical protein
LDEMDSPEDMDVTAPPPAGDDLCRSHLGPPNPHRIYFLSFRQKKRQNFMPLVRNAATPPSIWREQPRVKRVLDRTTPWGRVDDGLL